MNKEIQNRTELTELGEFGLIRHLTKDLKKFSSHTLKGVGDDAAVMDAAGKKILISTDLLVEGVHFDLMYTPFKHLGYKAAVVNFSDLAAMNAYPSQITVGLAISNRFSLEAIEELYSGIRLACEHYKVDLIGGDTTSSVSGLFISVTVVGYAEENEIVYRNTANENDLICVSGDLGAAYAGLLLLEREKAVFAANPEVQPDLDGHDYVLERQLKPEARVDIIHLLRENKIKPTAMIDISDGLASEIMHICGESGKGAAIYPEKIPIDPATIRVAEEFKIEPYTFALNGGEDYELLFTIDQKDFEVVKSIPGISVIGHITEANLGVNLVIGDGTLTPITALGWDAFKPEM
jgi:thiamine-monophosphate kinase